MTSVPVTPTSPGADVPILRVAGLTKSFGSNTVLKGLDLQIRPGEFVGLMGPNGAGKSTLIKILSGVYQADAGDIDLSGERVSDLRDRPEVGIVHQDLGLIDSLTVLDNLRLGAKRLTLAGPLLNRAAETRAAKDALARVGLSIPVTTMVGSLSPAQKAMLAIARLLALGARFIIVDETTSTLAPPEASWLIGRLRDAAATGAAVMMVSHKLAEIRDATDRIVVLMDGAIVADDPIEVYRKDEGRLTRLFTDQELSAREVPATRSAGETVLAFDGVRHDGLGPVSFTVSRGEVVGITGSLGSGLHAVGLIAAGYSPHRGKVVRRSRPAFVPPQREVQSLFPELPVAFNMTLTSAGAWRSKALLLDLMREHGLVRGLIDRLKIVPGDPRQPIGSLSGGNQQKVLLARALLQESDLYVLCEPTRGVDVRTRQDIYRLIGELRAGGAAVLVVTSDFEDILAACDRVIPLVDGVGEESFDVADMTTDQLVRIV